MSAAFTFAKAVAGEGALGPSRQQALRGKAGNRTVARRPRIDYFRGPRCNQDWHELESPEARALRGRGFMSFVALIHRERPRRCQGKCGIPKSALHLYHVLAPTTHRHLRFERNNVLLLCKECKTGHEQNRPLITGMSPMLRDQTSVGAAVAGSVKTTCKPTGQGPIAADV